MKKVASTLGKFFYGLTRIYRGFRSVILNLLFILLVLVLVGSFIGQPPIVVQRGSALVINPHGVIVDQLTFVDPLDALMADSLDVEINNEVLLTDILDAIALAKSDDNISSIVMLLDNLQPSGFSKLMEIAEVLTDFKASGKKVYAYADNYSQGQYYLAAHADEIILNPMGMVSLEGFGTYQMFYRDALDTLGINVHIFRVGEYKSAVEPYERNNMSAEAREANTEWLSDLWTRYITGVSQARNLNDQAIDDYVNGMDELLAAAENDTAILAMQENLVDNLMNRSETNQYLRSVIGGRPNSDEFLYINLDSYLSARNSAGGLGPRTEKIGLIVARGNIYDGNRDAGEIGGDTLADIIRRARLDDQVKALVLRIDSGGGSAFASEIIRSELVELRNAGKPLVVSMGSVAASGGYWIATPADEIWASASTITGSIGIFGLYPTFEGAFEKLGLNTDGVGTTDLWGSFVIGNELPPLAENILQSMIEDGYNDFIRLVAEARGMTIDEVDAVAQGRVWSGEDAYSLGLVDNIGNLDDAIEAAAALAGLDAYETRLIEQRLTPGQQLIKDLAGNVLLGNLVTHFTGQSPQVFNAVTGPTSLLGSFYEGINEDLRELLNYNDPQGLYLQCHECLRIFSQ
ncbi:MAG: signal peptide peptidase SppA [Gammaproteobacteria bacterium]|nr:signal peptide peptidase SppA [Gammaproteobacteria bacterium]